MGTLGSNNGTTFVDDSTIGTITVTNPSNVASSDNVYATMVLLITQVSHYLKCTNFNFTIPLDATVTGITVAIEHSSTVLNATTDSSIKIVKTGVISGNEKATGTLWPTSDAVATYGSASDLWGLAWTPADINASTFGVAIAASATLAGTGQVDYVSITVDYTGSNKAGNLLRQVKVGDGMGRSDLN